MKILVINSGSSTIKADVFTQENNALQFSGKALVEDFSDFEMALEKIIADFENRKILNAAELSAVGHRVAHGGPRFSAPVLIDDAVVHAVRECIPFAPLHNPANLAGIEICRRRFSVPQVAVFDTAFHQTMGDAAKTYAIPRTLSQKYAIRRYGFHGTSHEYVTRHCAQKLGIEYENFSAISLHLGNGASVCCVKNGQSIDTSMGFTPLEGLVMGTRTGDIDAGVALFLQSAERLTAAETDALFNKESGLKGLAGTHDMRTLMQNAEAGDAASNLAIEIFCLRARKYIGAYMTYAAMHAIIFTGGIGENAAPIREKIVHGLEHINLPPVHVIATDEERMIAEETRKCIMHVGP